MERSMELPIAIEVFVFASMGVLGSLVMIFSFLCAPKQQKKSRLPRLVLCIGIADLVLSICILYSQSNYLLFPDGNYDPNSTFHHVLCDSQAFLVLYAQLSKLFWHFTFASVLFIEVLLIFFSKRLSEVFRKYFWILEIGFHFVNWVVPALVTLTLQLTGNLGKAFIGCWIIGSSSLQFFIYYGPLLLTFLVTLLMYIAVTILVTISQRRTGSRSHKKSVTRFIKKNRVALQLSTYSLVFLVLWAPAVAGTIYNYITDKPKLWMLFPQFLWCWGGFMDGIVYSLKRSDRFAWLLTYCCIGKRTARMSMNLSTSLDSPADLHESLLPKEDLTPHTPITDEDIEDFRKYSTHRSGSAEGLADGVEGPNTLVLDDDEEDDDYDEHYRI